MEPLKPIWSFNLGFFNIDIAPEIVIQWGIILLVAVLAILSTRNLKLRPGKKQTVVEALYTTSKKLVIENMGESFIRMIPFIGSLFVFLFFMNFIGLIGLPIPTKNFSVVVGLSLITFFMVQYCSISRYGLLKYFKGYTYPLAAITPINILERVMLPVSLSLRLFGNVLAATVLVDLSYQALGSIGFIAKLGIPIPLHMYFDIFDGGIQTIIFIMLTMINIRITAEHSH